MSHDTPRRKSKRWLWVERLAWTAGTAGLAAFALLSLAGAVGARRELDRFAALQAQTLAVSEPDQSLWSPQRIQAWRDALPGESPAPLAVLRLARLGIEVAVLDGTDEWTLNRAVGLIEDTARPGSDGNVAIAGHRDGFFRGLKDIRAGDTLELESFGRVDSYRVEQTWIVEPEDVSVLDPTPTPSVTLVTCYPFYFVGSAPQRFIVRAERTHTRPRGTTTQ
jgi:sortase A